MAEEECGSGFGNDNERELIPVTDERFYLNTANPAPCTGNITGWHLCYYGPNLIQPLTQYWATYAVYRKIGAGSDERYERVSEVYSAVRGPPFAALFGNTGLIKSGFSCNDYSVETNTSQLTIQAGDVLGACVFTPIDGEFFLRQRLDIVGQTSGESLLGMDTSACNTKFLPTSVTVNELSTYDSRRLHLYADIGKMSDLGTLFNS